MDRRFLSRNHVVEQMLEALFKILDALLLKARYFALHEARHMIEFLLRLQRPPLSLNIEGSARTPRKDED